MYVCTYVKTIIITDNKNKSGNIVNIVKLTIVSEISEIKQIKQIKQITIKQKKKKEEELTIEVDKEKLSKVTHSSISKK